MLIVLIAIKLFLKDKFCLQIITLNIMLFVINIIKFIKLPETSSFQEVFGKHIRKMRQNYTMNIKKIILTQRVIDN